MDVLVECPHIMADIFAFYGLDIYTFRLVTTRIFGSCGTTKMVEAAIIYSHIAQANRRPAPIFVAPYNVIKKGRIAGMIGITSRDADELYVWKGVTKIDAPNLISYGVRGKREDIFYEYSDRLLNSVHNERFPNLVDVTLDDGGFTITVRRHRPTGNFMPLIVCGNVVDFCCADCDNIYYISVSRNTDAKWEIRLPKCCSCLEELHVGGAWKVIYYPECDFSNVRVLTVPGGVWGGEGWKYFRHVISLNITTDLPPHKSCIIGSSSTMYLKMKGFDPKRHIMPPLLKKGAKK